MIFYRDLVLFVFFYRFLHNQHFDANEMTSEYFDFDVFYDLRFDQGESRFQTKRFFEQ